MGRVRRRAAAGAAPGGGGSVAAAHTCTHTRRSGRAVNKEGQQLACCAAVHDTGCTPQPRGKRLDERHWVWYNRTCSAVQTAVWKLQGGCCGGEMLPSNSTHRQSTNNTCAPLVLHAQATLHPQNHARQQAKAPQPLQTPAALHPPSGSAATRCQPATIIRPSCNKQSAWLYTSWTLLQRPQQTNQTQHAAHHMLCCVCC